MTEVRAKNARIDTVLAIVIAVILFVVFTILVAGVLKCSPLLREEICTDGIFREGLRVLFGL